jgi:hypothetical protein
LRSISLVLTLGLLATTLAIVSAPGADAGTGCEAPGFTIHCHTDDVTYCNDTFCILILKSTDQTINW